MKPLQRIIERVTRLGDPEDPNTLRPLLTVDEFYVLFQEISRRPEVKDVRVKITAFDMPVAGGTPVVPRSTQAGRGLGGSSRPGEN